MTKSRKELKTIEKNSAEKNKTEKYRSRVHCLVLYPDCEEHCAAIEKLKKSYDFAYILHDKDIDDLGEIKKPHWHVVLRTGNATWNTALSKELGVEPNYLEDCRNMNRALLYLIHFNDPDKFSYNIEEVNGSLSKRLQELVNAQDKSEGEKVRDILTYIKGVDGFIDFSCFLDWIVENGFWADYRRAQATFCRLVDEHNYKLSMELNGTIKNQLCGTDEIEEEK